MRSSRPAVVPEERHFIRRQPKVLQEVAVYSARSSQVLLPVAGAAAVDEGFDRPRQVSFPEHPADQDLVVPATAVAVALEYSCVRACWTRARLKVLLHHVAQRPALVRRGRVPASVRSKGALAVGVAARASVVIESAQNLHVGRNDEAKLPPSRLRFEKPRELPADERRGDGVHGAARAVGVAGVPRLLARLEAVVDVHEDAAFGEHGAWPRLLVPRVHLLRHLTCKPRGGRWHWCRRQRRGREDLQLAEEDLPVVPVRFARLLQRDILADGAAARHVDGHAVVVRLGFGGKRCRGALHAPMAKRVADPHLERAERAPRP
mmetsp:Transcript_1927/g.4359  ORF Transcript_1927/g.4359 Transcript_1927/m.4359 type:complete len:320 (+) Transcript_1927:478-1437(+)